MRCLAATAAPGTNASRQARGGCEAANRPRIHVLASAAGVSGAIVCSMARPLLTQCSNRTTPREIVMPRSTDSPEPAERLVAHFMEFPGLRLTQRQTARLL